MFDLMAYESFYRMGFFFFALFFFGLLEVAIPLKNIEGKTKRWMRHFSLLFSGHLLVKLLTPFSLGLWSLTVTENDWGLFNFIELNSWGKLVLGFLLFDFFIYLQHIFLHYTPLFWRLHRVHHSDTQMDLTNGIRFHPLEIYFSYAIKFLIVYLFGMSLHTVVVFEIILNLSSIFTHSNIRLPVKFDHLLRYLIVTPDMHRIHHSMRKKETNSNFGFLLSIWDRIFKTYREHSEETREEIVVGLEDFRTERDQKYFYLLKNPFSK